MTKQLPTVFEHVSDWAKETPTPFYVYDEEGIRTTVRALFAAFSWNPGYGERYAVKACPTPGILRVLAEEGCGADCASASELYLAAHSGMAERMIFTSNETTDEEYRAAIAAGAAINLDDFTQIAHLKRAAGPGAFPKEVCLRYNPGASSLLDANTQAIMGDARGAKFGMTKSQLLAGYRTLTLLGVERFGLHAMPGSNSLNEGYYPALAAELFALVKEIKAETGVTIHFVDFGGGVGIPYRPEDRPVDIAAVGEGVRRAYEEAFAGTDLAPGILTELGRFVTGPHGYLVTKVIGEKHTYKDYVGVDATACDLMRPAMYGAYHHITVIGKEAVPAAGKVDVVGSLCENNDKFAVDRELPAVEEGDLLVIHDAGAHGRSMGYNYNGKPRCGEYLAHADGTLTQIRRRETLADLFATLDVDGEFACPVGDSSLRSE